MLFRWIMNNGRSLGLPSTNGAAATTNRRLKRRDRQAARTLRHEPLEARELLASVPILNNLSTTPVNSEWVDQIAVGNTAYYSTHNTINGQYDLWRSDGNAETTDIIKSFTGVQGAKTRVNNDFYFVAADDTYGQQLELWKSNGTANGTLKIKASGLASISGLVNLQGSLYFVAMNKVDYTFGLWKSDGTDEQTTLIKSLPTPYFTQRSIDLVAAGDQIFFLLDEGAGANLWSSRGTGETTQMVSPRDLSGPRSISSLNVIHNEVVFSGYSTTHQQYILWRSDGTPENTLPVQYEDGTIYGLGYYSAQIRSIANSTNLFFTNANFGLPSQLWVYSSTSHTVRVVRDSVGQPVQNARIDNEAVLGEMVYFVADSNSGRTIWKTDGTDTGTMVTDSRGIFTNPSQLTFVGNELFFRAFATLGTSGEELWKSNGSTAGTKIVRDIVPGFESSNPSHLMAAGSRLAFFATTPNMGTQPWSSDPVSQSTRLVRRLDRRDQGTEFYGFVSLGQFGLIGANISQSGYTILKTDGTVEGTTPITTLTSAPKNLFKFNEKAVFTVNQRLWITDGTAANTKPVAPSGPLVSESPGFIQAGNLLYFVAKHESGPDLGYELWRTDGTLRGTRMVRDIAPGALNSAPGYDGYQSQMVVNNGILYFTAYDAMLRRQLYRSNGTSSGTVPVRIDGPVEVSNLLVTNGRIYFTGVAANDYMRRLYSTDGRKITEIKPNGERPFSIGYYERTTLTALPNSSTLYFVASPGTLSGGQNQLWKTDGTSKGSVPALMLGANTPVDITDLTMLNGKLWFFGTDLTNGQRSLYVSDGTDAGTIALRRFESEGFLMSTHLNSRL